MRTLLLFLAILQLAHCGCPLEDDGTLYDLARDGECRGFHSLDSVPVKSAATQAASRCASIGGKPLIIHNEEQQTYWKWRTPHTSEGLVILGLVCNTKSNKYEWADGSAVDFKPAEYGPELDKPCELGSMFYLTFDEVWNHAPPVKDSTDAIFFCTTQLQQPAPGADGCDGFDDDAEDGVCYQVGAAATTWNEASLTCRSYGGELASIHKKQGNTFIRRLAVSKGITSGVFIGASAQKDGKFAWSDGTKMDYENYFPGFPKKNFGDCVAMDCSETAGQWMNTDCSAKYPVACIRPQRAHVDPVCTGEDYKEGATITSPGYPYSANTTCDYFLEVDPRKRVEVEIIALEANNCCDSVKIYHKYIGVPPMYTVSGEMANKKYTSSSNIMRVSWQPDGGVNVKGLVFKYYAV